jgi:hypothetical protein
VNHPYKPGIFWTWQDRQVEDHAGLDAAIEDMATHGFGKLLVQPRGCRYQVDDPAFIAAVGTAVRLSHARDLDLWLHLDPRSMTRNLIDASGEAAEFLIVAGTGDAHRALSLRERPLDVETTVSERGEFRMRLEYPKTRAYHVHSDGALAFRPLRLERCLAYRRDDSGLVEMTTLMDATAESHLFTSELSGYVEVFGRLAPPGEGDWNILAVVAFASNYPDYAGARTRARMRDVVDRYAEAGVRVDGLWWDEPGYCTGFDRAFRADRGRIPWGPALRRLHEQRTGRDALGDILYLLKETDDGQWGSRREAYYRTVEEAVFGAQRDLRDHARRVMGPQVRMGVHQTWHQNADDVINGCMDWWRGAALLDAGFSDVGDAERLDDPDQIAEVTSMTSIAVSLGRRSESREAYCNLWGVAYGEPESAAGPDLVDWWVDLQATAGCNWLAHTYGPTGYFERPPVWGPGYPHHPTWERMSKATARLTAASTLAGGSLPMADVALVYPLGALFRLGSDLANPLARGTHRLIDSLWRGGFELDVVSPEALRRAEPGDYRAIIYLHPFGATPGDVEELAAWREVGAQVIAVGLPPLAGDGFASRESWLEGLGLDMPPLEWQGIVEGTAGVRAAGARAAGSSAGGSGGVTCAGRRWGYRGVPGWGRPLWGDPGEVAAVRPGDRASGQPAYLGLLLDGLGDQAAELLLLLGLEPSWRVPSGALATRTELADGATLVRVCPARHGQPYHGALSLGSVEIEMTNGLGLLCLRVDAAGDVEVEIEPEGLELRARSVGRIA